MDRRLERFEREGRRWRGNQEAQLKLHHERLETQQKELEAHTKEFRDFSRALRRFSGGTWWRRRFAKKTVESQIKQIS